MYILDDGIRLNAKLDLPVKEREQYPLVIVIHGFTGNMEEQHITAVSQMLNEIGCATLRVDMYGHGKSDGSFADHTLYKWLTNTLTVIDYARGLEFVSDIYLCGHSQGGLTVMLAAGMKHDCIRGIIPMSPAVMIPDQARAGKLLGVPFDPNHIPDTIVCEEYSWKLKGNYIRVAQTIYAENIYTRFIGPVLLVHGDADESVPVTCSIDAQKLYRNAELEMITGDTHCYDFHLDKAVRAVKEWMQAQLEKDTGSCYDKQNT